jgi:hypothetical protein
VYGIRILPTGDPYIETAEKALAAITEAGNPGTFLVDTFPICASISSRVPVKHIPVLLQ